MTMTDPTGYSEYGLHPGGTGSKIRAGEEPADQIYVWKTQSDYPARGTLESETCSFDGTLGTLKSATQGLEGQLPR